MKNKMAEKFINQKKNISGDFGRLQEIVNKKTPGPKSRTTIRTKFNLGPLIRTADTDRPSFVNNLYKM